MLRRGCLHPPGLGTVGGLGGGSVASVWLLTGGSPLDLLSNGRSVFPAPGAALGGPQRPLQRAAPHLRVRGQADPGGCGRPHQLLREAAASHPEGGPGHHPPAGAPVRAQPLLLPAAGPGCI